MWLVYALLTVACTTTLGICFRTIALKTSNPRAFSFVYNFTMFVLACMLVFAAGIGSIQLNWFLGLLLVASGVGYGVFQRYHFSIRKHIEASIMPLVVMPSGIVGFILAVLWLGEPVTQYKIFGYSLIIFASLLIVRPKKGIRLNWYGLAAFAIGASLSIAATLDRRVAPNFSSAITYTAVLLFFHAFVTYLPYVSPKEMKKELEMQGWRIPVLATINVASLIFLISALKLAQATQVMPVAASNVVATAVLGIIILRERSRIGLKLIAALLTFFGLFLVSR